MDQEYDIVFAGALAAGRDPVQVKSDLARLFKSDLAGIERLFCGQPVIIKKGLDRPTADKYRAVLEKAGALCEMRARTRAAVGFTIAPAGTLLTAPRQAVPLTFDFGGMSLAAAGADILEGVEAVVAAPLFDLSELSVAPPGSELATAGPRPVSPPPVAGGAFSVAEPGAVLDTRAPLAAAAVPDVSRITLAPAGADVISMDERPPPPPPPEISASRFLLETIT